MFLRILDAAIAALLPTPEGLLQYMLTTATNSQTLILAVQYVGAKGLGIN